MKVKLTKCEVVIKINKRFTPMLEDKLHRKLGIIGEGMRGRIVKNVSIPTRTDGPSLPGEFPHVDGGSKRRRGGSVAAV
jgi:hypothetical protein